MENGTGCCLIFLITPGWWMCGVGGKVGWAPPSYLKKCEDKMSKSGKSEDRNVSDNSASKPSTNFASPEVEIKVYRAIRSYQADGPGQVSFEVGDTVHVVDKLEDGMSA